MEDGLRRGDAQTWVSAVSGASNVARTIVGMTIQAAQMIDHRHYDRAAKLAL
jgi:hypothetical protein